MESSRAYSDGVFVQGISRIELRWYVEPMKPTYFDFTVNDLDRAKTFFERVFEWRFEKFPMPYDYYRIQTGSQNESGIDGGIGAIADTPTAEGRP